jgi:hypothetical protein
LYRGAQAAVASADVLDLQSACLDSTWLARAAGILACGAHRAARRRVVCVLQSDWRILRRAPFETVGVFYLLLRRVLKFKNI